LLFGPKRDKVVRGWRKLDDEAIRKLHFSAEQSNRGEKKEVGSRYGGEHSCRQSFGGETRIEEIARKNLELNGKILKWALKK